MYYPSYNATLRSQYSQITPTQVTCCNVSVPADPAVRRPPVLLKRPPWRAVHSGVKHWLMVSLADAKKGPSFGGHRGCISNALVMDMFLSTGVGIVRIIATCLTAMLIDSTRLLSKHGVRCCSVHLKSCEAPVRVQRRRITTTNEARLVVAKSVFVHIPFDLTTAAALPGSPSGGLARRH